MKRWSEVVEVFDRIVELPERDRTRVLAEVDADLRAEVESLLRHASSDSDAPGAMAAIAETASMVTDRVGTVFGNFAIKGVCGRGGMGVVYRAVDQRLDRVVALKLLPDNVAAEGEHRKRFLREAKVAATVNHPNIATIYEVGVVDGRMFIAMELVTGKSLRERIGQLTEDEALAIARQILVALAAAHDAGITHRDLKPENVMLEANGVAKVLDFGLAQVDSGSQRTVEADTVTQAGRIRGTPAYMSPEQARGDEVDRRTDIYAFGIVLQELLTGARVGPVSPRFAPVIAKCIAHDPSDRYRSCADALAALARKRRAKWPLVVTALVLIAGASAFALTRSKTQPASPPITTIPAALAAFNAGIQEMRDSNYGGSMLELERAVALDPELAAAHWRLALLGSLMWSTQNEIAARFHKAMRARSRLDARERAMLDAIEPVLGRDPPDYPLGMQRMQQVVARFPDDAEAHWLLSTVAGPIDPQLRGIEARRAVQLDPRFADAWFLDADVQFDLGNYDDALASLDRCLDVAPAGADCLGLKSRLLQLDGRCAEAEEILRRAVGSARGEDSVTWMWDRAVTLHALGRPADNVRQALEPLWKVLAPTQPWRRSIGDARIALAHGEFQRAEKLLDEASLAIENNPDGGLHFVVLDLQTDLALEAGNVDAAGKMASAFLQKADRFLRGDLEDDPISQLLRRMRDANIISQTELEARLSKWASDNATRYPGRMAASLWFIRDIAGAYSVEDARVAMTNASTHTPPLSKQREWQQAAYARVRLLAGQVDEALPVLEGIARSCFELNQPIMFARNLALYGQALEAKGRTQEACVAYGRVLDRWGKERSVTADGARARISALGCR